MNTSRRQFIATAGSAEFRWVFHRAVELNLPGLLHPALPVTTPQVKGYEMVSPLGNMLDDTIALGRLILSGILDELPKLNPGQRTAGGGRTGVRLAAGALGEPLIAPQPSKRLHCRAIHRHDSLDAGRDRAAFGPVPDAARAPAYRERAAPVTVVGP